MKCFVVALLLSTLASAAIWPENVGTLRRSSASPANITDSPLWKEYGLEEAEEASYEAGKQKFSATAYRFQDSTGAMAALQWQRPIAQSANGVAFARGNYLLVFYGRGPDKAQLESLAARLPRFSLSPSPGLSEYLPVQGRVPNSERYILGPISLQKFAPEFPSAVAAFSLSSEAQLAMFRQRSGEVKLAIFSFPTPQIARELLPEFEKIPGAAVKRSGPLIAAVVSSRDAAGAEKLLSQVQYQAAITWSERVPTRRDNVGDLILNVFTLIGILLGFCVVSGLAFGGLRAFLRGKHGGAEPEAMIALHLNR